MHTKLLMKLLAVLFTTLLIASCSGAETPPPPQVGNITGLPDSIQSGTQIGLSVEASGQDLNFEWTATDGSFSDPAKAAVIYTAPSSPGEVVVTVYVTSGKQTVIKSIKFKVITSTLMPTLPVDMSLPTLPPTFAPAVTTSTPSVTGNINMTDFYFASGWMGDGELSNATEYIQFNDAFTEGCFSPPSCMKITWKPGPKKFAGIYWQYPDGNWGEKPGCNLSGVKSVTFQARGDKGEEIVQFEVALSEKGSRIKFGSKTLTTTWQQFTINIPQTQDLTNVVGAFAWIVDLSDNPEGLTFYLDDIQFIGIGAEQVTCP